MTTDQPTIADVWEAFVALNAAWIKSLGKFWLATQYISIQFYEDGSGVIRNEAGDFKPIYFANLADALTAIAEARAGLEG